MKPVLKYNLSVDAVALGGNFGLAGKYNTITRSKNPQTAASVKYNAFIKIPNKNKNKRKYCWPCDIYEVGNYK